MVTKRCRFETYFHGDRSDEMLVYYNNMILEKAKEYGLRISNHSAHFYEDEVKENTKAS